MGNSDEGAALCWRIHSMQGRRPFTDHIPSAAVRGRGPLVRLRQLAALACGLIRFDPDVRVEAADWVRVEGGANTPVQVDGEMLCALPVEISLHPQRLQLILPMV